MLAARVFEPLGRLGVRKLVVEENPMASTYYDRVFYAPRTCQGRRAVPQQRRPGPERDFSEDFRNPRFMPGWFILPSFALAVLIGGFYLLLT